MTARHTLEIWPGDTLTVTIAPDADGVVTLYGKDACEDGEPIAVAHVDGRPLVLTSGPRCPDPRAHPTLDDRPRGLRPDVAWRWGKWTFGLWTDSGNRTVLGIDVGPLEVVWRRAGYRP